MVAVVEWLAVAEGAAETAAVALAGTLGVVAAEQVAEGAEATVVAAAKGAGTVVLVVVATKCPRLSVPTTPVGGVRRAMVLRVESDAEGGNAIIVRGLEPNGVSYQPPGLHREEVHTLAIAEDGPSVGCLPAALGLTARCHRVRTTVSQAQRGSAGGGGGACGGGTSGGPLGGMSGGGRGSGDGGEEGGGCVGGGEMGNGGLGGLRGGAGGLGGCGDGGSSGGQGGSIGGGGNGGCGHEGGAG
eukprot:3887134-Prymnesium_polylepis.1